MKHGSRTGDGFGYVFVTQEKSLKRYLASALAALLLISVAACDGRDGEAKKLTPPDDIDWEAIEAEGEAMNAEQRTGE